MATKTALVVSGGGSKGAFAVGAIEVLLGRKISFDLVTGTSTGALIAPLVATGEIALLRHIYSTVRTSDVLRQRSGAIDVLSSDAVYDTAPLRTLIDTYITDERYGRILASATEIELCSVNLQSGEVTYFNPKRDNGGGAMSVQMFKRAILASASQPVLMPPVQVRDGGDQFVDGGVREVTPLKRAVDAGATDAYVIVLSPEREERKDKKYVFIVDTLLRTLDLLLTEAAVDDLKDAVLFNKAVGLLGRVRKKLEGRIPAAELAAILEDASPDNPFRGRRALNLTMIRPAEDLPADGLTFSPLIMSEMMRMGAEAATRALPPA